MIIETLSNGQQTIITRAQIEDGDVVIERENAKPNRFGHTAIATVLYRLSDAAAAQLREALAETIKVRFTVDYSRHGHFSCYVLQRFDRTPSMKGVRKAKQQAKHEDAIERANQAAVVASVDRGMVREYTSLLRDRIGQLVEMHNNEILRSVEHYGDPGRVKWDSDSATGDLAEAFQAKRDAQEAYDAARDALRDAQDRLFQVQRAELVKAIDTSKDPIVRYFGDTLRAKLSDVKRQSEFYLA